jgi:hypothetical protein
MYFSAVDCVRATQGPHRPLTKQSPIIQQTSKHRIGSIVSGLVLALGTALLVFMGSVEGEPGALPLVLILTGTAGLLLSRSKKPTAS